MRRKELNVSKYQFYSLFIFSHYFSFFQPIRRRENTKLNSQIFSENFHHAFVIKQLEIKEIQTEIKSFKDVLIDLKVLLRLVFTSFTHTFL